MMDISVGKTKRLDKKNKRLTTHKQCLSLSLSLSLSVCVCVCVFVCVCVPLLQLLQSRNCPPLADSSHAKRATIVLQHVSGCPGGAAGITKLCAGRRRTEERGGRRTENTEWTYTVKRDRLVFGLSTAGEKLPAPGPGGARPRRSI